MSASSSEPSSWKCSTCSPSTMLACMPMYLAMCDLPTPVEARKQESCPRRLRPLFRLVEVGNVKARHLPESGAVLFNFLFLIAVEALAECFAYVDERGCFQGEA
ncbi:hypothetical protein NXX53_06065 [Bacteroides salyersiae]|nr:hypothetical protein [Bacteroides salyersiae]